MKARVLCIDYGEARCGFAWTDPLGMFASPLGGCARADVWAYAEKLFAQDQVSRLALGYPLKPDGSPTDATPFVEAFQREWEKRYPCVPVVRCDERYTSRDAADAMIQAGVPRKKRRDKLTLDAMSATLILQRYLESNPPL